MKTRFVRKAFDIDDILFQHKNDRTDFVIEKIVYVDEKEYNDFKADLSQDKIFIHENLDNMYVDENGIFHCILVKDNCRDDGILVESEGYDYPRYAAYYGG